VHSCELANYIASQPFLLWKLLPRTAGCYINISAASGCLLSQAVTPELLPTPGWEK
jgi:hypothetical protein